MKNHINLKQYCHLKKIDVNDLEDVYMSLKDFYYVFSQCLENDHNEFLKIAINIIYDKVYHCDFANNVLIPMYNKVSSEKVSLKTINITDFVKSYYTLQFTLDNHNIILKLIK